MPDINPGSMCRAIRLRTTSETRPYPNFGPIGMMDSGYNSNYNSLQLSLEKRMSHGLSFLANYTWSKALERLLRVRLQRELLSDQSVQPQFQLWPEYNQCSQRHQVFGHLGDSPFQVEWDVGQVT